MCPCPIGDICRIKLTETTVSHECGSWFCVISDLMDLTHLKDQATEESGANNFFGKYHYEINKNISSNTCWTQLLVPPRHFYE